MNGRWARMVAAGGLAAACVALAAPGARAGDWMQVSCENPNGTAAPSEGWTGSSAGVVSPGSDAKTACAPGSPMSAHLAMQFGPTGPNSSETLTYTPPAGSTLAGGRLAVDMSADTAGSGFSSLGDASIYSPDTSLSSRVIACVVGLSKCGTGQNRVDYVGAVALPVNRGGNVIAYAKCGGSASCSGGTGHDGDWAATKIARADLLLSNQASPAGADFAGSALQPRASGVAHVVFTASAPGGPGVYAASTAIDGHVVWSGQPNSNGGRCLPVGTDPGTGALMFDYAQPCLGSETVDLPVPTRGLPDGRHELSISVTDAAQNTATVLDRTIDTSNPQITPKPRRGVRTQFVISWRWAGRTTTLRSVTARAVPRGGRISIACHRPTPRRHPSTRGCPKLKIRSVKARSVKRLLGSLRNRRFRAGVSLYVTVSAPHRRAEHLELRFRTGREPIARLHRGAPKR